MIPIAVEMKDITVGQMKIFGKILNEVDGLPNGLDCHDVCAALKEKFPELKHVRGAFLRKGYPHSWLTFPGTLTIIDPYPWAGANPILLTLEGILNPWRQIYLNETEEQEDGFFK